jgi:hypothetical protein
LAAVDIDHPQEVKQSRTGKAGPFLLLVTLRESFRERISKTSADPVWPFELFTLVEFVERNSPPWIGWHLSKSVWRRLGD